MDALLNKIQNEYGFSDFQIKLIKYSLTAIFYDLSKMLIFMIYYHFTGKLIHFFFAVFPLIFLRLKNSGLHFRTYWSCFLFTFFYLYTSINLLPSLISIHPLGIYIILIICAILNYLIGPNSLTREASQNVSFIRKSKIETFQLIMIIGILFFIFSPNEYLMVSFWTVILHTIQLSITKIIKEVKHNEEPA